jgi:hypothetical protein
MNRANKGRSDIEFLASLCHDAIVQHGAHWPHIQKFFDERVRCLTRADRLRLISRVATELIWTPPRPDQQLH